MKKEYVIPNIEVIKLDKDDIITSSFDRDGILGENADNWYGNN